MMHGTREEFEYAECTACGSVQIVEVPSPADLARHYPTDYYSFKPHRVNPLKRFLMVQRDRSFVGLPNLGGRFLRGKRNDRVLESVAVAGLSRRQRILDVGCGAGLLLDQLARLGFESLVGTDPFLAEDRATECGVPLLSRYLHEVEGSFDIVMFNHSLEHVADPAAELRAASERLAPGGRVLVRLPTTSSEAWETYGVDWIQLDPPRHLVVPSREGMSRLAAQAGLKVTAVHDDSSWFQFVGSELYRRDIPITSPAGGEVFTEAEVAAFDRRAEALNRTGRGDQALFILEFA